MRKVKWLLGMVPTLVVGCNGCAQTGISGALIGLPNITIPHSAVNLLCRDVEPPLGIAPTTNYQKWTQIRGAFGLPGESGVVATKDTSGANNERHDCQGLITTVDGKDKYSAFVTLWVSSVLERPTFPNRTVVAGITLAGAKYDPLHIKQTKNCVILQGNDPNDNGAKWRAWIVKVGDNEMCDADHVKGKTYFFKKLFKKAHRLNVYRHSAAQQPVAGRWIDTDNQYYIGLQCGPDHFCVLGVDEAGIMPTANIDLWNAGSDHQRLAKKVGGALVPSRLRGTIAVTPGVHNPNPSAFSTMTPVATVSITGNDDEANGQYSSKWGIGAVTGTPISLSLQYTEAAGTSSWNAKYGAGAPRPVIYEPAYHSGMGTVRWRWDPNDEGTWKQCGGGCCGS